MYKGKIKWKNVLIIGTIIYSIGAAYQIQQNNELISQQTEDLKEIYYELHNEPLQFDQKEAVSNS